MRGQLILSLAGGVGCVRALVQYQVALANEPFVHGDAPLQGPRTVVGNDDHEHVVREVFQERADMPVDLDVVVTHGPAERMIVAREARMPRIAVVPEGVVQAVRAHLHHHEQVPRLRCDEMLRHGETAAGHRRQLRQQRGLVVRAELADIEQIVPFGDGIDLGGHVRAARPNRKSCPA